MSKNVSLFVGFGLAVALAVPLNLAKAQLTPPAGQADPKAEEKKADEKKGKQKANEGQPAPPKGPPQAPPGRGPGDRPRADTERQGPRPGQQRPPEQPKTQQPATPPSASQQTPPAPPKKEFLPRSTTVPQMKPRPDQGARPDPQQALPTTPKNANERNLPGQPPPVVPKAPVATPQTPPIPPGAPRGASTGNQPGQPAPVVPKGEVATPQTPQTPLTAPGAPVAPRGAGNRGAPDPRAPSQASPIEGVPPRAATPAPAGPTPSTTAQPATATPSAVSKIPTAVLPVAPTARGAEGGFRPGFQPAGPPAQSLGEIQKGRTQRVEAGGKRTVIQENDNRIIIKQDNRIIIRHDETPRFARNASDVRSQRRPDGTTQTVIIRPGGVQLFSVVDNSGRILRRYRRDDRGREINIIDNRRFYRNAGIGLGVGLAIGAVALALRPPEVRIDRAKYIVDYERASDDDIYEALSAAPIERLERRYSLDEIRFSNELRGRMRRVDLDTITFEFGSWDVGQEQFPKLERVAKVIGRIIAERPNEVFLIEGHTDAVGADVDNLTLSDRRAQAVAEILSSAFNVPPENLVTQGYGEQYLKIPTQEAERQNRRVTARRITPLMSEGNQ